MEDFVARISDLEAQANTLRVELEDLTAQYLQEANRVVSEWFTTETKTTVVQNPERAKTLGKEGLGQLKRDVAELQGQIAHLLEEHLNNEKIWSHRGDVMRILHGAAAYDVERKQEAKISGALSPLYAELGEILNRYELIHFESGSPWTRTYGGEPSVTRKSAHPSSPELSAIRKQYVDGVVKLLEIQQELARTLRAKEEAEATDLWEQA